MIGQGLQDPRSGWRGSASGRPCSSLVRSIRSRQRAAASVGPPSVVMASNFCRSSTEGSEQSHPARFAIWSLVFSVNSSLLLFPIGISTNGRANRYPAIMPGNIYPDATLRSESAPVEAAPRDVGASYDCVLAAAVTEVVSWNEFASTTERIFNKSCADARTAWSGRQSIAAPCVDELAVPGLLDRCRLARCSSNGLLALAHGSTTRCRLAAGGRRSRGGLGCDGPHRLLALKAEPWIGEGST